MKKSFFIVSVFLILMTSSGFAADMKIQYRDGGHGNSTDNHIKPHLKIINKTSESVALSELTIRYYYSKEGTSSESFHVDYAYPGLNNITGTFYDDYVEIGFTSKAGSIASFGNSGEIQLRFNKNDWSDYNETNDYSYKNHAMHYVDCDKITLYKNGILIWGREPEGNTPPPAFTPLPVKPTEEYDPEEITFIESDGMVVIEAEHYSRSFPGRYWAYLSVWREISFFGRSGNKSAMVAFPNRGINVGDSTHGPGLEYKVDFNKTGTYYFWVRMWGPSFNDNSLHSGLDGIPVSYGAKGMTCTGYGWKWVNKTDSIVTVTVESEGLHVVNIWMREDGTWIDKILLTSNPDYVPKGPGPDESPREFTSIPEPTPDPIIEPTDKPTAEPTIEPTADPTTDPTIEPTDKPTTEPTDKPTAEPTIEPTIEPTDKPTAESTIDPTPDPTIEPTPDPTPDPTTNPTIEPTAEPTPDPTQIPNPTLPLNSLKVQYQCGVPSDLTNMIRPYIKIVNTGTTDVLLNEVFLHYYYTKDGATDEEFMVDDAPFGAENVVGTLMSDYLQIDFKPEAGVLSPESATGEILCGVLRSDGSPYDQSNDYSYDPTYTEGFGDFTKITLFVNDSLLWGYEPGGPTPLPTAVPTPE